ncbi:13058_t:CDS:2 [Entrophospora sp. SA101]|nr:13058_t:CDS:2 [Entrophospora sp. SA101]
MSSRGMLTITYALDEQIQDWKGKSGEIDQEMILDCSPTSSSSSTSPNSPTNPTSLLPYKKHPSYVASSTDKNKKPNSVQFIDDNNTTNTANSPIASRSPSRTNTPLSYVASLTDKNKKPNSIQFIDDNNTMNTTNSPIVSRSSSQLDTPFALVDSSQSPSSPVDINGDSEIDSQFSETYSSSTANDKKKPKLDPNSKIIVCGQPGMINVVEKLLKNLGFTEDDFILIA